MSQQSRLAWAQGHSKRAEGLVPNTQTAKYHMRDLIQKGHIPASEGLSMLAESHLNDFVWEVTWAEDYETPDEEIENRLLNVQGYVIFIHGWTGNHTIWEELPGLVVSANRRLVAISIDHNGFGQSEFTDNTPEMNICNPPAAMETVQRFIDLIKIRRQPGENQPKVINFVGHSMGGATLFYLNPIHWRFGEETRYALAPALLLEDEIHKAFYTTLGLGIGILQRIPVLEVIERLVKPTVLETLTTGSSQYIKQTHDEQYQRTPRGITGATFMAMGLLKNSEIAHKWDTFRVMLGHRDPLVGLVPMMDLLYKLEYPVANLRVVPGTHYMFSIGNDNPHRAYQHAQNREVIVQDIVAQHQMAYEMQRTGKRVG